MSGSAGGIGAHGSSAQLVAPPIAVPPVGGALGLGAVLHSGRGLAGDAAMTSSGAGPPSHGLGCTTPGPGRVRPARRIRGRAVLALSRRCRRGGSTMTSSSSGSSGVGSWPRGCRRRGRRLHRRSGGSGLLPRGSVPRSWSCPCGRVRKWARPLPPPVVVSVPIFTPSRITSNVVSRPTSFATTVSLPSSCGANHRAAASPAAPRGRRQVLANLAGAVPRVRHGRGAECCERDAEGERARETGSRVLSPSCPPWSASFARRVSNAGAG